MISVGDLRAHLRLPATRAESGEEQTYLLGLRTSAVAYLQREMGRYFGPLEEVTHTVAGIGTGTLWLPDDLAAASEDTPYPETINEYGYVGGDPTEVAAAEGFVVAPPRRLIRRGGSRWLTTVQYEVTYWRGYVVGGLDPVGEYEADPEAAAAAYPTAPDAYLIGAPGDAQHATRLLVAHWYTSRLPIVTGTISEELPHSLQEIIAGLRYLHV